MGFVYVVRNPGHREGVIKIGQTTDMETRLSNLNAGNYLPFEVLKVKKFDDTEENTLKKYLNYCLPLIPYSWITFAYIFIDRWLLQYYSGSVEQAYYSVAAQFAAIALIFTTSILRIFWKEISEVQIPVITDEVIFPVPIKPKFIIRILFYSFNKR